MHRARQAGWSCGQYWRPWASGTLHLEKLSIRDVTTGLVDTYSIPRLLSLIKGGRLDPTVFVTHRFALDEVMDAYDAFANATQTGALKVALKRAAVLRQPARKELAEALAP